MAVSHNPTEQNANVTADQLIQTILLPTDFSEASQNAYLYAAQMASTLSAKIILLHVYEYHPILSDSVPQELTKNLKQEKLDKASKEMDGFQEACVKRLPAEVEVTPLLKSGIPEKVIMNCVEEENADLIIMGTLGAASVHEHILGSVTAYMVQHAKIPVLAIPAEATYKPIRTIQYAMNMDNVDLPVINRLVQICEGIGAKLCCTHIKTPETNWTRLQLGAFNELAELEKLGLLECYILENDSVDEGLQQFLLDQKIDCLSMTTHMGEHFVPRFEKSTTREMLMFTDVPLLTFHA